MMLFKRETVQLLSEVSLLVLERGVEDAVALWRDKRRHYHDCVGGCPYTGRSPLKRCGFCLEAQLRTLNLYRSTPIDGACSYLEAARTLSQHPLLLSES